MLGCPPPPTAHAYPVGAGLVGQVHPPYSLHIRSPIAAFGLTSPNDPKPAYTTAPPMRPRRAAPGRAVEELSGRGKTRPPEHLWEAVTTACNSRCTSSSIDRWRL